MPVVNFERLDALTPEKWEHAKAQIPDLAAIGVRAIELGDRVAEDLETENHRHGGLGWVLWKAYQAVQEARVERQRLDDETVDRRIALLAIKRDLRAKVLEATEKKLRRLREAGLYPARQDRLEERAGDLEGEIFELDAEIDRLMASELETEVEGSVR